MSDSPTTGRGTPWVLLSVTCHVVLVVGIYLLVPLRTHTLPEHRAQAMRPDTASRRRVEAVQRQLAQRAEERLRLRVEQLRQLDRAMEQVEDFRREAYEEKAAELSADALTVALTEMEQALAHQQDTLVRQDAQWTGLAAASSELDAFLQRHAAFSPTNRPAEATP